MENNTNQILSKNLDLGANYLGSGILVLSGLLLLNIAARQILNKTQVN